MTSINMFDLNKLDPFFLGYDGMVKKMNTFHETLEKKIPGYPPYNIKKIDDNKYVVEMAVAGFSKADIEITLEDDVLKIQGKINDDQKENQNYLYRGIAERGFYRSFNLADSIVVKNADLFNGMLKVWLEAIIPEHKKPRKIEITGEKTKTE